MIICAKTQVVTRGILVILKKVEKFQALNASESTLDLLSQSDHAPLNSTGVNAERNGLISPIKIANGSNRSDSIELVDNEKWIASFLDVMDSDSDDESEYSYCEIQ